MKVVTLRWHKLLLGVMDSGSVRRAGEEDDRENELKPFVAVQRVQLPSPAKAQPATRKRALHVCGNVTREAYGSRC